MILAVVFFLVQCCVPEIEKIKVIGKLVNWYVIEKKYYKTRVEYSPKFDMV